MYKVTYYTSGSMVAFKWFNTFGEASEFSLTVKSGDVIEIKLYKEIPDGQSTQTN